MGYTTEFSGAFALDRPLTEEHARYLTAFAETRRMQRNARLTAERPDPLREAVGLPIGPDGAYYVGTEEFRSQEYDDADVLNANGPPIGQPGLWCQWRPARSSSAALGHDRIQWDGGEKFYEYVAWLGYLVKHFLKPWGYVLSGTVHWQGEDTDDYGELIVRANVLFLRHGARDYGPEQQIG